MKFDSGFKLRADLDFTGFSFFSFLIIDLLPSSLRFPTWCVDTEGEHRKQTTDVSEGKIRVQHYRQQDASLLTSDHKGHPARRSELVKEDENQL